MIVFDTETTGLPLPLTAPIEKQPHILEFAGIKLCDTTLEEVGRFEFLAKPPFPISAEITAINGIKDSDVADKPPFAAHYLALAEFFLGERVMVAHNLAFDRKILAFALKRLEKHTHFPWPIEHICTIEKTMHMKGHRLNLTKLHEECFGVGFAGAHRAMADVEALVRCVRYLRGKGKI
jgi:DNA polymerase-3 subunit epsilon